MHLTSTSRRRCSLARALTVTALVFLFLGATALLVRTMHLTCGSPISDSAGPRAARLTYFHGGRLLADARTAAHAFAYLLRPEALPAATNNFVRRLS